jgi:hypothetical protein
VMVDRLADRLEVLCLRTHCLRSVEKPA